MNHLQYMFTFIILFASLTSCKKYEIISRDGPVQTIDKGNTLFGGGYKYIKKGTKISTDTTTGELTSLIKYRIKYDCYGDIRGREKKRHFDGGIWFRWLRHTWRERKSKPSCRQIIKHGHEWQ